MSGQNNHGHTPHLSVIQGDGVPSVEQIVGARTLNGKRGLILGMGLGGIAQGCLATLSAFGASTAVAAINQKVLGKCEEFIDKHEFNVPAFLTCDVSKPGDVDILFSSLRSATRWESLDFVIFSVAGAPKDEIKKPLKEATREGLTMALEISAFPLIELARNCEEMMTQGGTVISLGYLGEERVVEGYDLMAPVKAFLRTSMLYLAAELGPKNIRFHDVSPGPIPTRAASGLPGFNKLVESSETSGMLPGHVNIYDVGHMVAFLVSDAALHMTAETIHVDLGTHAMGLSQDHGSEAGSAEESSQAAKLA